MGGEGETVLTLSGDTASMTLVEDKRAGCRVSHLGRKHG